MDKEMTDAEFARRSSEDMRFLFLCGAKNNMSMYHLMRDEALDAERQRRAAEANKEKS